MFKDMTLGTVIFIWILILIVLVSAGSLAWRYYTAEIRGIVGAEEQIQSGANRIDKYNHFFDLCAAIKGHEGKLDAQMGQLNSLRDNGGSERDINRVTTNIAGLQGIRVSAIQQYNADARKEYTAGQFRDSSLPWKLNDNLYNGEKTSCN